MKNTWLTIATLATIATLLFINQATQPQQILVPSTPSPLPNTQIKEPMDVDKLTIEDIATGLGQTAQSGNTISVHYTGTLLDGTQFDSSRGKDPFTFQLGEGMVIDGWDQGLIGMKVGGKRKLTIPSSMGYGARGAGGIIPPNAGLIFEVELINIR